MIRGIAALVTLGAGIGIGGGTATAQELRLEPSSPEWVLRGDARVGTRDGEPAILLRTGNALLPELSFGDGTVEFEMLPTHRRAFLGFVFRIPREGQGAHYEDLYLRLHKSGLPDALQYTPDYYGRGQWQLYHGPDATAAANFARGGWQRVRIEVAGHRAALFVGDVEEPQLVVDRLRTDSREGSLGFWANFPGATEDDPWTAALRNVVVRPGVMSYDFPPARGEEAPEGVVTRWGLSEAFVRLGSDVLDLPESVMAGPWHTVEAETSGLVPLDRHLQRPEGGPAAVLAGLRIEAASPRTLRLDLGYSDDVSVFLNGRLLFSGRNGFSTNFPRRQGLITLDQGSVHLPLETGENRVVIAVSEVFGGWGLLGRIPDPVGVEVRPMGRP